MNRTLTHTLLPTLMAAALAAPVLAQSGPSSYGIETPKHQVTAGTQVRVKLLQDLKSDSAQAGDTIRVQVAQDDTSGLPTGTIFNGRVVAAKPATAKQAGVLRVRFGGGNSYGGGYGSASSRTDLASATFSGKGASSDKSQYQTYGAGAGAVIGLARKGKLGDAITGAILGGAGGYAANQAQKHAGTDVSFKKGDEMTVRLDHSLIVQTQVTTPY